MLSIVENIKQILRSPFIISCVFLCRFQVASELTFLMLLQVVAEASLFNAEWKTGFKERRTL